MCGIAGMILRRGSPDIAALSLAATRLGHRGPDDSGVYRVDSVGLAHTRLSIIDLGGGHQPILDTDGHYALVANGEIYNFVELRAELEADGCRFRTHSDSETILHVYDRFGVAGLERLNGMFAFALYSTRDRTLILGRDRLGIKPLYYAVLPDRVAFASEIKGLLPLLPRVPEISPEALARFFEIGFNSGEETILQGIRKLEPGTALVIDASLEPRQITYWSALDIQRREMSMEEACEELDPLFDQVLREHMRSDVPYGLFLSGGLDSGILMARLSRWGNAPLRTFSVGYAGTDAGDELADARRVAERFGSDHTELRLDMLNVFRALPLCVRAADDLMYDPACLPTALMAQAAARELKVVFTGEGGDEVFAGYGRYRRSPVQQLMKQILHPRTGNYRRGSRWPESLRRSGFGDALEAGRKRLYAPVESAWAETPHGWGFLRRAQYTDLRTELADNLLVKVDRILMAFGLEGRVPVSGSPHRRARSLASRPAQGPRPSRQADPPALGGAALAPRAIRGQETRLRGADRRGAARGSARAPRGEARRKPFASRMAQTRARPRACGVATTHRHGGDRPSAAAHAARALGSVHPRRPRRMPERGGGSARLDRLTTLRIRSVSLAAGHGRRWPRRPDRPTR
ncbi:putative Asparagine synthase (glutamine-hydrolyzing) [Thiocapsa sp. KS1]|nr:putative Asparagine synthase (glutamine-hydrolyzing) [Thiocapsa sp. KS1]